MTILATSAIRAALESGAIICEPKPSRIEGAHIDVTLGRHYWLFVVPTGIIQEERLVLRHENAEDWFSQRIADTHNPIVIPPRGFILAHTAERIGTAHGSGLVPMLHTRSTLARWGLSVCTANAGQGDEGYCSHWTLEIHNPHAVTVMLPVGARVGSIAFHRTEGAGAPYEARYNAADWSPLDMLPRRGNW